MTLRLDVVVMDGRTTTPMLSLCHRYFVAVDNEVGAESIGLHGRIANVLSTTSLTRVSCKSAHRGQITSRITGVGVSMNSTVSGRIARFNEVEARHRDFV
jgi:hypothetical protein